MTFDEYQKKAITTDVFKGKATSAAHPAFMDKVLGLVGESGEVAEKFKKILRDKSGEVNDTDKQEIMKELGDVLWYINAVSCYMDISLEELAAYNLEKLQSRKTRGQLRGSGDNR